MKRIICLVLYFILSTGLFAESAGVILVLSSLSSTGLTAVSALTDMVGKRSARLERMREFVDKNGLYLASDAAGSGKEYLGCVADIAGVKPEKRDMFFRVVRESYATVFPGENIDSNYSAGVLIEIAEKL
ncbi:MAG: DUF3015 family protein [Spirochaetes bacterium]|nr:DUF3015 family protein [Spirochaetota bacterium]MBN2771101.1 DUF3015 family protein [Spirochaetota bacterium]